jgi:hypothetical protein
MSAADFKAEIARRGALHECVGRYSQALMGLLMQSTACMALHSVQERCARWLLMTHDRVRADEFSLSHEFLAMMLGSSRPTVSVVAGTLQGAGLIRYTHGRITIANRDGLETPPSPSRLRAEHQALPSWTWARTARCSRTVPHRANGRSATRDCTAMSGCTGGPAITVVMFRSCAAAHAVQIVAASPLTRCRHHAQLLDMMEQSSQDACRPDRTRFVHKATERTARPLTPLQSDRQLCDRACIYDNPSLTARRAIGNAS